MFSSLTRKIRKNLTRKNSECLTNKKLVDYAREWRKELVVGSTILFGIISLCQSYQQTKDTSNFLMNNVDNSDKIIHYVTNLGVGVVSGGAFGYFGSRFPKTGIFLFLIVGGCIVAAINMKKNPLQLEFY